MDEENKYFILAKTGIGIAIVIWLIMMVFAPIEGLPVSLGLFVSYLGVALCGYSYGRLFQIRKYKTL